ncbi:hypothetical protein HK097_005133, partial [Rhizophlyctis rosea]
MSAPSAIEMKAAGPTIPAYPSPPITPSQSPAPYLLPVNIPQQGRVTHEQNASGSPLSTSIGSPSKTSFFSKFRGNRSETNLPATHSRKDSSDGGKGHTRSKSQLSSDDGGKPSTLNIPSTINSTRRSSASSSAPSSTSSRGDDEHPPELLTPPVQTPSSYEESPTSPFFRRQTISTTLPRKKFGKTRTEKLQATRGNSESSSGYASGTESPSTPYPPSLTSPSTLSLALSESDVSPTSSPATTLLQNPKLQTHLSTHLTRHTPRKNTFLHRTFPTLPQTDPYIDDFTCALSKGILHQGGLYLSLHHICFSGIFGTSVVIPFKDVTEIRKRNTA